MADGHALVCMRVADAAEVAAGSARRECHDCGCAVWISPASARIIAAFPDGLMLCIPCFETRVKAQGGVVQIARPTHEQICELEDHFAPDPEEPPPEELP